MRFYRVLLFLVVAIGVESMGMTAKKEHSIDDIIQKMASNTALIAKLPNLFKEEKDFFNWKAAQFKFVLNRSTGKKHKLNGDELSNRGNAGIYDIDTIVKLATEIEAKLVFFVKCGTIDRCYLKKHKEAMDVLVDLKKRIDELASEE